MTLPPVGKLRRFAFAAILTAGLAVPPAVGQAAAGDGDLHQRLVKACARAQVVEQRLTTLSTRLDGGTDVTGSLAWFQAEIAKATAANRPKLAATLQQRFNVLSARRQVMAQRQPALTKILDFCASKGITG